MRFVHIQTDTKKYAGITIAYTRTEGNIFFSYALCCKPDTYSKSLGRVASDATYLKHLDDFHHDVDYVDEEKRIGCMSIANLQETLIADGQDKVFADQLLESLTWMDLKHLFVSKILVNFIFAADTRLQ